MLRLRPARSSGGSSQRQAVPQEPVSLGQSVAWSRAGRPYRPCFLHSAAPLFPRLPGVAALLVFLSLGVVLSTEALLRSTGANAERAEDRVLRRCIGTRGFLAETTVKKSAARPSDEGGD